MSTTLGEMVVKFGSDTSGLKSGISDAKGQISGLAGVAGTIGRTVASAMVDMGREAVGFGVQSVQMAGDFQASMTKLVTSAGESQSNLKMVSDGVLSMASEVGTSTKELSSGMYMVESAGFHGAAALDVLKASAMGAKAEGASLGEMANAVTSGLNAYALSGNKAAFVTNILVATTAAGKMKMQDLAASISTVIPVASKGGISLQEVGAAMATMTSMGTPAAQATTYLRQMIVNLEAPGSKAVKTMAEIGLSSTEVAQRMRQSPDGMISALEEISVHLSQKFPGSAQVAAAEFAKVKAGTETMDQALAHLATNTSPQYIGALKDISGGSKNMMAMMELTGPQLGVFRNNLGSITDAANKGGKSIAGWDLIQGNFNFKMDQAKASVEALMIGIGTQFLPVVTKITGVVAPVISAFSDWITKSNIVGNALDGLNKFLDPISANIGHVGDAFTAVFAPAQKVKEVVQPLTDSFDRAKGIFHDTATAAKPLLDSFDRAKSVMSETAPVVKPLMDSFDRGKSILADTAKHFSDVQKGVNPLIPLFTSLKPYVNDVVGLFKIGQDVFSTLGNVISNDIVPAIGDLVSSVSPIIDNFITWEDKTHFLQNTLQDVGGFIHGVADSVANNLMPPIRDVISAFQNWLSKSGFVHDALGLLGGAIDKVSGFVGGLLTGLAGVFKWFGDDAGRATALKDAIFAIGGVIAGVKILQFGKDVADGIGGGIQHVKDFADAVGKIKDKAGEVLKFFQDTFKPQTAKALDDVGKSAGTTASTTEGIGTSADKAEVKVAADSVLEKAEISGVGATATTTSEEVAGIGTSAGTASAVSKSALGGMAVTLGSIAGGLLSMVALAAGEFFLVKWIKDSGWIPDAPKTGPNWVTHQNLTGHASGIINSPTTHVAMVGEHGPEMMVVPQGASIYPNNVYPSTPSSAPLQGMSGGSRPIQVVNNLTLRINGRDFAVELVDDIGSALVDRIRSERPVAL